MKCLMCKSETMVDSTNTYFTQLENGYVIIENVPCRKCTQCGEVVYSALVVEKLDETLDSCKHATYK